MTRNSYHFIILAFKVPMKLFETIETQLVLTKKWAKLFRSLAAGEGLVSTCTITVHLTTRHKFNRASCWTIPSVWRRYFKSRSNALVESVTCTSRKSCRLQQQHEEGSKEDTLQPLVLFTIKNWSPSTAYNSGAIHPSMEKEKWLSKLARNTQYLTPPNYRQPKDQSSIVGFEFTSDCCHLLHQSRSHIHGNVKEQLYWHQLQYMTIHNLHG